MDHHDHNEITHSLECPEEGCAHKIEVHAHDDGDAVNMLMEASKAHFDEVHPDAEGMSPEEMEKMTYQQMKIHGE